MGIDFVSGSGGRDATRVNVEADLPVIQVADLTEVVAWSFMVRCRGALLTMQVKSGGKASPDVVYIYGGVVSGIARRSTVCQIVYFA